MNGQNFQVEGTRKNFRHKGRKFKMGIKNVAMVQQTGNGCHKIFAGLDHKGTSKIIRGTNKIVLSEKGFTPTKIK